MITFSCLRSSLCFLPKSTRIRAEVRTSRVSCVDSIGKTARVELQEVSVAPALPVPPLPAPPVLIPTTPQACFDLVASSNPACPSAAARKVARGLLPLTHASDGHGLKAYYYKHPHTGLLTGSQVPLREPSEKPLEHREIARSFIDPKMSKTAARELMRACVLPAPQSDSTVTWGGTRLIADNAATEPVAKLRLTCSGHFKHPSNDAAINETLATFYANVCILSCQPAEVVAGEAATEALARRVRAKLRAHFQATP